MSNSSFNRILQGTWDGSKHYMYFYKLRFSCYQTAAVHCFCVDWFLYPLPALVERRKYTLG